MALASLPDVEARLGRSLSPDEILRVGALLEDASAVVIGHCRRDFLEPPVPSAVVGVVAKMAARALSAATNTGGGMAESQAAGPFSVKYTAASTTGDVWLTAADKLALRPYCSGGLASIGLVGARYRITDS